MKKVITIILIIMFMYIYHYDEYNITDDSIRFRVIANSNSSRDIIMKEKVVEELSNNIFKYNLSKEETEENIYKNLNNIENKINNLFKNNNYDMNYNIMYGMNYFPKKIYRGKKYNKGLYKSLVIEIGEAKGNNYFCILYPSLCVLDYEEKTKENKEIRFRLIENIKNFFK
ncbi:MAG: stage II sporulation protein R [Bacilli bacterium]|nr:stage II sporulation protein R [Bacilli bacterium]